MVTIVNPNFSANSVSLTPAESPANIDRSQTPHQMNQKPMNNQIGSAQKLKKNHSFQSFYDAQSVLFQLESLFVK